MKKAFVLLMLLSYGAMAQTGSEIYLFDLKVKKGQLMLTKPQNITNHKGYDNQPFFDADHNLIYYSSFNDDGRSDIRTYNYETAETKSFTQTQEREYSPTLTPDKQFISCIIQRDNNAQDLGKYPVSGGEPAVIINNMTVGYHVWLDNSHVVLFVLGTPNTLHLYQLPTKEDTVLAENIGRSLHIVPGPEKAFSFVHKISDQNWVIKKVDVATRKTSTVVNALPGREDIAWTKEGLLVTSDGTKLFVYQPGKDATWREVKLSAGQELLKGVTRIAVSQNGEKLAIVVAE